MLKRLIITTLTITIMLNLFRKKWHSPRIKRFRLKLEHKAKDVIKIWCRKASKSNRNHCRDLMVLHLIMILITQIYITKGFRRPNSRNCKKRSRDSRFRRRKNGRHKVSKPSTGPCLREISFHCWVIFLH